MEAEGHAVSLSRLCRWLEVPRRSVYYRPTRRRTPLNEWLVAQVKAKLEQFPTYGYRRLAAVLGVNRKPVQRILQRKGWQVRKRPQGHRPRAKSLPSVATRPDERWATDLTQVWCGKDRRAALAVIVDCCTREVLGWRLSSRGSSPTAEAALEEALIQRLGVLQRVAQPLALRSDNGLVFSSRRFTATVKAYGLNQEFTTPYTPEQNGLIERFFRSLKEECIWQHRFESLGHARAVIGDWIRYYNEQRPHQALGYAAPRAHPALSA
ncbi:IS3 family transposase [Thioalkalivibrio sp. ALgr3]|uniref:IS3 family transposase n=3 Tax=unclassified Thioalkalivibrio TaxID=2621013 RepID=UPI0003805481|nr:IS3 family transposase [Thioalkalivibrio sp. ALgr3]